jgi:hypothetical protein
MISARLLSIKSFIQSSFAWVVSHTLHLTYVFGHFRLRMRNSQKYSGR